MATRPSPCRCTSGAPTVSTRTASGRVADAVPARPEGEAIRLPLAPRLASWNRADDPDQLRLARYLAATGELIAPRIEELPDPLALRLDVGLASSVRLLDAHDLDNYLFPLATWLTKLTGRRFATVWGTKAHRAESFIRVGTAIADVTSRVFTFARLLAINAPAQSVEFKEQIRDQLVSAEPLPDGPISLDIAFVVAQSRNWANLWKPTIDSLEPILGRTRGEKDWHPRDGRIVELALHGHSRPHTRNDVTVAIGANSSPDG
jgi:hypothetical protein